MKRKNAAIFFAFFLITTFTIKESFGSPANSLQTLSPTPPVSISFLINEYYQDVRDLDLVYIFRHHPEYFSRFNKLYSEWIGKLQTIDFNALDVSDRVDFILLKRNIQNDEYDLKQDEKDYALYSYALPFADSVVALQQKRRRGQRPDAMATAKDFNEIQLQIDKAKTVVLKTPLPDKNLLNKTIETIKELRNGLKNVYDFYNGYDPEFTWWMKKTYPDTDSALVAYSKWLSLQPVAKADKAMDSSGIIGHPVGLEKIDQLLKSEMIPYSPEELIKIAYKEFAWCDSEMLKASRQMGFGNDWKKALGKVKENYVTPGGQPQLINHLEEHAIAFIEQPRTGNHSAIGPGSMENGYAYH